MYVIQISNSQKKVTGSCHFFFSGDVISTIRYRIWLKQIKWLRLRAEFALHKKYSIQNSNTPKNQRPHVSNFFFFGRSNNATGTGVADGLWKHGRPMFLLKLKPELEKIVWFTTNVDDDDRDVLFCGLYEQML